ncbi:MAG: hypothetical protein DWQ54_11695 [Microcystis flos-aquae TF09]|uniref:ParE-like toxin domain-containing protein n=1 Tax=Microcystis flos-aquae TF09 TaxID=2060473 RepID=A0A3E0L2M1_9CHRO|nr:MAG: hypothetical protein DWQ54_11695 [Microcystis flos-aquae TF09]
MIKIYPHNPPPVLCYYYTMLTQNLEEPPSLRFKKVHPQLPIYSARINRDYRAVGQLEDDTVIWFWVGSHTEYDMRLEQL